MVRGQTRWQGAQMSAEAAVTKLAVYRRCAERMVERWPLFQQYRTERFRVYEHGMVASEQVTVAILNELFTGVLDWGPGDLNPEIEHADLVITRNGIRMLIIEMKRPGALKSRKAVDETLDQGWGYAARQRVKCVAVSDGTHLYAADILQGGLRPRVGCRLDQSDPPAALWWLSVYGITRAPDAADWWHQHEGEDLDAEDEAELPSDRSVIEQLDSKYRLPARCFAYVGDHADPRTWKLPYRTPDGAVDRGRLPQAIRSIVDQNRGQRVKARSVPDGAVPDVLVRLGNAAFEAGRLPSQNPGTSPTYVMLVERLEQLGRLHEVIGR